MKRLFFNVTIAFSILGLASCLKNGDTPNTPQGAFSVNNLSPDATPVNINLNSSGYVSNLAYGVGTIYQLQTAGSYNVVVSTSTNSNALSNTITIEANKYYSYFIIDSLSKLKSAFTEDKLMSPGPDSVYIRFLHFSPNAGVVNFRDSASTPVFTTVNRTFNDQSFSDTYSNFTRIKAGAYVFKMTPANNTSDTLATIKATLEGGRIYTFLAKGVKGATDTKALGIGKIQNY